jgi:hypothetical protein
MSAACHGEFYIFLIRNMSRVDFVLRFWCSGGAW